MSDLKYCPEHDPAFVQYRSEVCPMCTLEKEAQARKKTEGKLKELQEDSEYYFDHMMRYMMFIRDNGHTKAYIEYAKERCYDKRNPHSTQRSAPE